MNIVKITQEIVTFIQKYRTLNIPRPLLGSLINLLKKITDSKIQMTLTRARIQEMYKKNSKIHKLVLR